VEGILYTEYNTDNVKYHGNPFSSWQDWCGIDINNNTLPCNLLMYLHLHVALSKSVITKYGSISMPEHYDLVHTGAENGLQTPLYTAK